MKRAIFCALIMTFAFASVQAQTTRKKTTVRRTTAAHSTRTTRAQAPAAPISAVSTGSYAARGAATPASNDVYIADPTIRALNARANGSDVYVSNSGIVGMPKRAYGFANGHLMLASSGSTSSGTMTGSGTVGTGSSLGTIGSNGPAIGLNGKSPYAGSTMWGNARGMTLPYGDSTVRPARARRH